MATPGTDIFDWSHQIDKQSWEERIREHQKRTFLSIHEQRTAYKEQSALYGSISAQLVPGDTVMVKLPGSGKVLPKWQGPYKFTKVNIGGSITAVEINGSKTVRLPSHCVRRFKIDEKIEEFSPDPVSNELPTEQETTPIKEDNSPRTRKKFVDYTKFY